LSEELNISAKEVQLKLNELIAESSKLLADDVKKALSVAEQAQQLAQQHFHSKGLADSFKQLSSCYSHLSDYGNVMRNALEAKELYQGINDLKGEADCLNILGGVYNFLQDYNKRLECNLNCLELRKKADDMPGMLSTLNNIGDTYTVMADYENALKYFNECLTHDLNLHMKAIVYYNIGEVNFFLKNYTEARKFILKGLDYGEQSNYWQIIIVSYQMQASIFLLNNEFNEAIDVLLKAEEVAKNKGSKEDQFPLYELFSEAYGGLNNYEKAYEYLNLYNKLKKEIMSYNNAQKLKKIEFEFQFKSITTEAEEIKKKNKQLSKAFKQIEIQRNEIESKNVSITDSIHYAKRIQNSILPPDDKLSSLLPNSFVYYEPKDIVSGDFYWIERVGDEILFSVIDCTGHGVPGAFVSLIAFNMLNKVVLEKHITQPASILKEMDNLMKSLFSQSEEKVRDGVDMGICTYNTKTNKFSFSGAFHSLFICNGEELKEIKGNRESIGFSIYQNKKEFINHEIELTKGDTVYLSTDGFPDQFGGRKGKKLKWKGFRGLLCRIHKVPIINQKDALRGFFQEWRKDQDQLDDVCVLGVSL